MPSLAFDRNNGTARRYDSDGRLYVSDSVISRACISPYNCEEIPGWRSLGLTPGKTYQVLRPVDELRAVVDDFNGLPLLSEHVAVNATNHRPGLVVGATSSARLDGLDLRADLVVWASFAIEEIEGGGKRELSCAYAYQPVLESGVFRGEPYDVRMTELIPNHVALVPAGRVPGAMIADSKPISDAAVIAGWRRLPIEWRKSS